MNDIEIILGVKGLPKYEQDIDKASKATKKSTSSIIDNLKSVASAFGLAFGGAMVVKFFKDSAQAAIKFETLNTQFSVFLGSSEKATKVLADLNKFSIETPFTPDQVNAAGRSLLAFGFTTEKLMPTLRMVGDVSAAVGKDFNELATIYGKARTAGTLFAEDINQLTEAGIPIIEELARVMGVNADQVKKLGSQGKIHFAELEKAFANMTSTGGRFSGMMDKMSQSTEGLLSTIEGKLQDEMRAIGQAMLPTIRTIAEGFEPAFAKLKETFTEIYAPVGDIIAAFSDLLQALGLGSEEGNAFADIVGVISTVFKVLLYPTKLIFQAVGFLVQKFADFLGFAGDVIAKVGEIGSAFDVILLPIRAVGAAWDKLFGNVEKTSGLSQVTLGAWNKSVGELQKAYGATDLEMNKFISTLKKEEFANLSARDAGRLLGIQLFNFLQTTRDAGKAAEILTSDTAKTGDAFKFAAGSIGHYEELLKLLQERYKSVTTDFARNKINKEIDALNLQLERLKGNLELIKTISFLPIEKSALEKETEAWNKYWDAVKNTEGMGQRSTDILPPLLGKDGQDQLTAGLGETTSKFEKFANTVAAIFHDLRGTIKMTFVDAAATIAEGIGNAIATGGSALDVFKTVLKDLLVQVPKLAGMALLNFAATVPGPQSLPIAAAGLALIGLSGLLGGLFKGKEGKPNSIASDIPAPAVQRTQNNSLNAFGASINNDIGQQVADALDGRRMQLVLSDGKQLDAYVKDANKRNNEREGK